MNRSHSNAVTSIEVVESVQPNATEANLLEQAPHAEDRGDPIPPPPASRISPRHSNGRTECVRGRLRLLTSPSQKTCTAESCCGA